MLTTTVKTVKVLLYSLTRKGIRIRPKTIESTVWNKYPKRKIRLSERRNLRKSINTPGGQDQKAGSKRDCLYQPPKLK
jgi:hypothetical protein